MMLPELMYDAEVFKQKVWAFLDEHKLDCEEVRNSINEMLDTLDDCLSQE